MISSRPPAIHNGHVVAVVTYRGARYTAELSLGLPHTVRILRDERALGAAAWVGGRILDHDKTLVASRRDGRITDALIDALSDAMHNTLISVSFLAEEEMSRPERERRRS